MNWAYLRRNLLHRSPLEVAARYALRGVNRAMELLVVHGMCVTPSTVKDAGPTPRGLLFGWVEEARLRKEALDPESGITPATLEQALAAKEECFGAFVDGVLACYLWFAPQTAHLEGAFFVRFSQDYAYSRWAFTRPRYRGQHLHALAKRRALEQYVARGKRGILSVVSAVNYESLQSARRLGCESAGVLVAARAAGEELTWRSDRCRRYGLALQRYRSRRDSSAA